MKRLTFVVCVLLWCALPLAAHAATQKGLQFKVRIVPLDCTIETINYGDGPVQVVTCPDDPEPEPEPQPEPQPSPQEPEPSSAPGNTETDPLPESSSRVIQSAEELEEIFNRIPDGLTYTLQIEESLQQAQSRYANNILFGQIVTGLAVFSAAALAAWQLFKVVRADITLLPLISHRWQKLKDIFWRHKR